MYGKSGERHKELGAAVKVGHFLNSRGIELLKKDPSPWSYVVSRKRE